MNRNKLLVITTMGLTLVGCNTTGINRQSPETVTSATMMSQVIIYPTRADLPKNSRFLGKVTALNKLPNGLKASPDDILIELKRNASQLGANGLVHITPGTAQTTADAILVR